MKFWKMNGAGNDFIILNNMEEHLPAEAFSPIARTLCERHMSIGADGMMVVEAPTQGGDFKMLFFNSDGSMGEMCGNGARCICRYGYETGLAGSTQTVETTAGIITGTRIDSRQYKIRLNDISAVKLNTSVHVNGRDYACDYVELGNPSIPHVAIPYQDLKSADEHELRELGRTIRWHKDFPKGTNVNFYEILGEDVLYERTFERGVEDFTYACGTGTGSVVAALTLSGKVSGRNVQVHMTGGTLIIDAEQEGSSIANLYLTGPTNIVAKGEITDEDLRF